MNQGKFMAFVLNKRKITIISLSLLLIFLGSWGLGKIGFKVPILKELFGFISLVFIPGTLIMAILKYKIEKCEDLLYAIGISLFFIMASGFFANIIYPLIGIENPISEKPLIIILSGGIFLLIILFNLQVKDFTYLLNFDKFFHPFTFSLLLLLLLTILGTYLVNIYNTNILLLIVIFILALLPLFALSDKFPKEIYPFAVFAIAISLMYHTTLIGNYAYGDIQTEFWLANLIKDDSHWNPTMHNTKNNLLSLVMLIPTLSIVLGMGLTWIYKVILPFFSCLVPVGVYLITQRQTNEKIGFLSSFYFISLHIFFMGLLTVRFRISEFFLVLLILTIVSPIKGKKPLLSILFAFSIIVSYYGTAYISIIIITISTFLLFVLKRVLNLDFKASSALSWDFVSLFLVFLFSWYIYVANSATFKVFVDVGYNMLQSLEEVARSVDQGPIDYATRILPFYWEIYRWLNYTSQFFIMIGGIWMLQRLKKKSKLEYKLSDSYILLAITCFIILFAWIVYTPVQSGGGNFGFTRLYSLLLLILAPLCIIGGLKIGEYTLKLAKYLPSSNVIRNTRTNKSGKNLLYLISIFLTIFLLFSSNFVMEVCGGYSISRGLSQHRVMKEGSIPNKLSLNLIPDESIYGIKWISNYKQSGNKIYADGRGIWFLQTYGGVDAEKLGAPTKEVVHRTMVGESGIRIQHSTAVTKKSRPPYEIEDDAYVYLRKMNVVEGVIGSKKAWWLTKHLYPFLNGKNKIYTNGGSTIYK